jgi:hypothetical protein
MDEKTLKEARLRAERAVADMAAGELKVKAFEVILGQLLAANPTRSATTPAPSDSRPRRTNAGSQPKSLSERILALQADGFFGDPQTIGAVREGLKTHGWHYPATTLSGALQNLVQKRKLRRERVRDKGKTAWRYSNP